MGILHFTIIELFFSFSHFDNVCSNKCPSSSAQYPCEKPVCCNKKKHFPRNTHYIDLVYNACSNCLDTCPQQLGDSCGGEQEVLKCDWRWLRCKKNRCKDQSSKNCINGKRVTGTCVRKYHTKGRMQTLKRPQLQPLPFQSASLANQFDPKKYLKIGNGSMEEITKVPVCELIKGEKTCQCDAQQKDKHMNSDLSWRYKWCFLGQISDAKNPTSNCFSDVEWSKTAGRFWSYKAYNHTYNSKSI